MELGCEIRTWINKSWGVNLGEGQKNHVTIESGDKNINKNTSSAITNTLI